MCCRFSLSNLSTYRLVVTISDWRSARNTSFSLKHPRKNNYKNNKGAITMKHLKTITVAKAVAGGGDISAFIKDVVTHVTEFFQKTA